MRRLRWMLACAALLACAPQEDHPNTQTGTAERDARDSIIGQSQLPGARTVESARDIQATSKERAAALDSIQ